MVELPPAKSALKYPLHYSTGREGRDVGCCSIAVIGVGRAGNNTLSRLMESGLRSAECIAINTDSVHLSSSKADRKILIGERLAKGLRVEDDPRPGEATVVESKKHIENLLSRFDVAFVTADLGDETGTGAALVVAETAKQKGAITVGVVTMPFPREKSGNKYAHASLTEMRKHCDTVVAIDEKRLMQLVPQLTSREAFRVADKVLANMIKEIVETISTPSLVNPDLADFKAIISKGGMAVVGVGESDAPNRAEEAVRNAFKAPLLDADYAGATGALIHVAGDNRMTIKEADRVREIVTEMMDGDALVIWGASVNPQQEGKLKVTLVMTGVNSHKFFDGFRTAASQLFNLDPYEAPEKALNVDLKLYQMEIDSQ